MKKLLLSLLILPSLCFGTTSVFYPVAGSTTSEAIDGFGTRSLVDETFATIKGGSGTSVGYTGTATYTYALKASTTLDQFKQQIRSFFKFDTSAIGSDTISDATISFYFASVKVNDLGSSDIVVTSSTGETYQDIGGLSFGSLSSTTTGVYNDVILNASGISNISKTGISRFGTTSAWDNSGSFDGTWVDSEESNGGLVRTADQAGTTNDPKLTVEHTAGATTILNPVMIVN